MTANVHDGLLQIFDVDHGACALLTIPGVLTNWNILIDCGHSANFHGRPWYPGPELKAQGIYHIDLLLITNYDEDHMSGARSLLDEGITVERIFGNPSVSPDVIRHLKQENGMGVGTGVIVTSLAERLARNKPQHPQAIPGLDLRWFWNPWPYWSEENNLSLVCYLSYRGIGFLFTGDMERRGMCNLLDLYEFSRLLPQVDVLMAPHHGRENGKCPEMFNDYGCNPKLVVISDCAKRYQSQETVGYYGSKATGIDGFRRQGPRSVLTTRSDSYMTFSFRDGRCIVN